MHVGVVQTGLISAGGARHQHAPHKGSPYARGPPATPAEEELGGCTRGRGLGLGMLRGASDRL